MKEVWRDIEGYEGLYQVSNKGNVRSLDRDTEHPIGSGRFAKRKGRVLKASNRAGYPSVMLTNGKSRKTFTVHRLVAIAFIPNCGDLPCVNHKDGNKENNHSSNLEWASYMDNSVHAVSTGLVNNNGHRNTQSKLTEDQVKEIRELHTPRHKMYSSEALGKKYGVSDVTICNIINNKTWRS